MTDPLRTNQRPLPPKLVRSPPRGRFVPEELKDEHSSIPSIKFLRSGQASGGFSCERCGHRDLKRDCSNPCSWGTPYPAECLGKGVGDPGTSKNVDSQKRRDCDGTTTGKQVCINSCKWGTTQWDDCIECQSADKPTCHSEKQSCEKCTIQKGCGAIHHCCEDF